MHDHPDSVIDFCYHFGDEVWTKVKHKIEGTFRKKIEHTKIFIFRLGIYVGGCLTFLGGLVIFAKTLMLKIVPIANSIFVQDFMLINISFSERLF